MAEYKLKIRNTSGVLQAEVTDFTDLSYVKAVNSPGVLQFSLPGGHSAIQYLTENAQVSVWRRDKVNEIEWYLDFDALFKNVEKKNEDKAENYQATCPGILSMLSWRIVAWYANTTNRSAFVSDPIETIMKTIVSYNASDSATVANGRLREGDITSISVEADGAAGTSIDYFCAYKNVLLALQEISNIAQNENVAQADRGDFDLVRTGDNAFEFRFYDGQLGTDRMATVSFALERGNMANPVYTKEMADEKTVAIVAGQGSENVREIVIETGNNYSSSRNYELFSDARDVDTAGGLQDRGRKDLFETKAKETLTFDVLQTPSTIYGKHYFLGDLVTAKYLDITMYPKIVSLTISIGKNKKESIDVGLEVM